MHRKRVKRLPVVTGDGTLVGIVSRSDVLSVYRRPDATIEREITEDLLPGTFGYAPARFDVTVKAGVVTIAGRLEPGMASRDIIAAARHVEGVVAVRDRLMYPLVMTAASDPPPY
jgi:osmotically-inducible protein OsmY